MTLPPADPILVAETVAALPSRLQKRLDATIAASSGWLFADDVVDLGSAKVTLRPERGSCAWLSMFRATASRAFLPASGCGAEFGSGGGS